MNEKDKISIQKNYSDLVHKSDIDKLLPILISKGVFTHRSAEPYQHSNFQTALHRKRELFANILRRGPEAFQKLVASLREINDHQHHELACLLEGQQLPKYEPEQKLPPENSVPINNNNQTIFPSSLYISQQAFNEEDEQNENKLFVPINNSRSVHPFKLPENQRPQHIRQLSKEAPHASINLSETPLQVVVKKSTTFFDDQSKSKIPLYRMRGKCRGIYLGINNIEFINNVKSYRTGAMVDEKNLEELFHQMGFITKTLRNQTRNDIMTNVMKFADVKNNKYLKHADCLVLAIMSHGQEGATKESSYVIGSDNAPLPVSWIIEQFDNQNCVEFQNKPKIFLFQICRGDNFHFGVPMHSRIQSDGINITPGHVMRNMTDVLIAFSTLPGDKSYRDTITGTWYIQLICEIFMKHAYDTDVEHLLKMVDEELKNLQSEDGNMQTSSYESRAFKRCYLHPGLYE